MGGKGSGGANRRPVLEHIASGSFRFDRHGAALAKLDSPAPEVDAEARARVVDGLGAVGRRVVEGLLDGYADWDAASLHTLRAYAVSCDRLAALDQDDDGRRREARLNLLLLRALGLDK